MDTDIDIDIEELKQLDWNHVPQCEAVYDENDYRCENPADLICGVSCCNGKILLCEDCYVEFVEFSKEFSGVRYRCGYCDKGFELSLGHLSILGKV